MKERATGPWPMLCGRAALRKGDLKNLKNFRSKDSSWAEFERSQKARGDAVRAFTKLANVFVTIGENYAGLEYILM